MNPKRNEHLRALKIVESSDPACMKVADNPGSAQRESLNPNPTMWPERAVWRDIASHLLDDSQAGAA